MKTGNAEFGTVILTTWKKLLRHTSVGAVLFTGKTQIDGLFAMQKHRKIRNVPVPRLCGAAGNDVEKLFVHVRGALFMQEASWRMRRYIEISIHPLLTSFLPG
ncbi:hypothetical protein [uncultured Dysosmobacter sp.]|uniref:hypothetical protein n=1 Tax=uncultured Dysosmobacter sp. TaxID=2591384 RepID=UPI0026733382|nr:hypothetical protein [uncultured Dysosmobacter sp.]